MNKRKTIIMITILLLSIGFATVSTVLYISGIITIGQSDDLKVYYSYAEMTPMKTGAKIERQDDSTNLVFNTGSMSELREKVTVNYKIKNDSRNFNANVVINCTANGGSEYLNIENKVDTRDIETITEANPLFIERLGEKEGKIEITLVKSYAEETGIDVPITCELNATIAGMTTTTTVPSEKLCKRATSLHSDGTHTFGQLGTEGTLTSGDAFDCNVDGKDGYNSETERFYYVTDLDNETAVLLYYNNTNVGIADASKKIAYNYANVNNLGPVAAIADLPSKDQWVTQIYSNPRQITNENGGLTTSAGDIVTFDYGDRAARLLTVQELMSACGITVGSYSSGELNTCTYLMENTYYTDISLPLEGYWLETPFFDSSLYVWLVDAVYQRTGRYRAREVGYYGTRPVIEVKKSDMSY